MDIQNFLKEHNLDCLLLNTTNEFLVEYNTLQENSLYKLTGFSGSTGQALVTSEKIFLFVDGRYHIQAEQETDSEKITVIKLNSWKDFWAKLREMLPQGSELGLFSKKNSLKIVNNFAKYYKVKLIDNDPFDNDCAISAPQNISVSEKLTGMSTDEKVRQICHIADLKDDEMIYLTDLDDVSYLFNLRNYETPYSAKIRAKALIYDGSAKLFLPEEFKRLEDFLKMTGLKILIDPETINAYDAYLLENQSNCFEILDMDKNPVKYLRTHKTDAEINHLKDAFARTDKALSVVRDYIYSNDNISEYDIEQKLREEFKNQGAVGLSFKPIIAKDKNSALAHYSKSSKDENITDGNLVLIDCGAYFDGGLATDITRVFVKGEPSELHKKIYTTVLKAFLNAFNYYKDGVTGYDIDDFVRKFFEKNDCDGFVFNHGLGHGIGINVHEAPPNLSNSEIAKTHFEDNMCFTIEPGLYKEGKFGVRLENSCYFKDGKIYSFVKMNYEKKLIDFGMLSQKEKEYLSEFEVR